MKTSIILFVVFIYACKGQHKEEARQEKKKIASNFRSFGAEIDTVGTWNIEKMNRVYKNLAVFDTVKTKFSAKVIEVCKAKGCWMKVRLNEGSEAMVKFKDYGFFMPTDIVGKEAVIHGLAFVEELSGEEQKHYAKDSDETAEAIAQLKQPKKTYGFQADGVIIKK